MKASLSWLRSLLPSLDVSDDRIVEALVLGGWSVQSMVSGQETILRLVDTDRVDVLGHVGLARELSVLFRLPFDPPGVDAPVRVGEGTVESRIDVAVREPSRCTHYGVLVVEDVRVCESPSWLRDRLEALGIATVNNVTDLTRLVLLESGHPVEVYDLDRIEGTLEVRLARDGEVLKREAEEILLDGDDLVIADERGPVGLAGVVAASRGAVSASTTRVVFECACFAPRGIRRTLRRLGLTTESSLRHERGVNPADTADVLAQAGFLATHMASGAAVPGSLHVVAKRWEAPQFLLRGASLPDVTLPRAKDVLERLGCDVVPLRDDGRGEGLHVSMPPTRGDLSSEADLLREVRRVQEVWEPRA
jgi:phenylalanyl-tRNA synthetase beta chain